jgi:uncharacterized membrane protein YgcG/exonuclease VII small subunit
MRMSVARGVGAVVLALWLSIPGVANADEPVSIEERITDRVDALGDRRDEVEEAVDRLFEDHRLDLYVVYVDNFSGMDRQEWAETTAERSQLGINDALLAVATGERVYQLSVDADYPLTDEQLEQIETEAIEPPLRANDWAGGAIGAANGIAATLSGQEVQEPEIVPGEESPSAAGGFPWVPVLVGAGVVGVGAYAYTRARRRRSASTEPSALTLDELDARASSLLVETDDAVKTSEQELGFATAQFGEEAAAPFAKAIEDAKADLTASFRRRQQLDDAIPEDDATRRQMLEEIITRCESANESLDAQADAFDRLRALEQNAPEVLAEVEQRAAQLEPRVAALPAALDALRGKYSESALEPVANNDEQATERLDFVRTAAADARQRLDAGDTAGAAVAVLAAQEAVGQATQLIEAVDRLGADLDQAAEGLRGAVQEAAQDLSEAKAMLGSGQQDPELASRVASAEHALTSVQQELSSSRFDPLAATKRIEQAHEELAAALQGVRDEQARQQRARAVLDQTMLAARSEIAATQDFVTTRRGGVGSQARTRLAEAQRHLEQAMALAQQGDPEAALQEAQYARQLAGQAGQLARSDVGSMTDQGGPFGGGSAGGGLGGAILGGILIDSVLGGRRGGGMFGGGFGGSGSRGGGSRSPGSFGGRGTRARRGGGGRF